MTNVKDQISNEIKMAKLKCQTNFMPLNLTLTCLPQAGVWAFELNLIFKISPVFKLINPAVEKNQFSRSDKNSWVLMLGTLLALCVQLRGQGVRDRKKILTNSMKTLKDIIISKSYLLSLKLRRVWCSDVRAIWRKQPDEAI